MIGIIVVTHLDTATPFIQEAERMLGKQKGVIALNLHENESLDRLCRHLSEQIENCFKEQGEEGEGVLILTDLFGSSPTNACLKTLYSSERPIEILTGVNLPMVISSLSYRTRLPLKELAEKVLADGQKGIKHATTHA